MFSRKKTEINYPLEKLYYEVHNNIAWGWGTVAGPEGPSDP